MLRSAFVFAAAVTIAGIALTSTTEPSMARGGRGGGGGHAHFSGGVVRSGPVFRSAPVIVRRSYAPRRYYAGPVYAYGYGYGGCEWPHRRAIVTGSPY